MLELLLLNWRRILVAVLGAMIGILLVLLQISSARLESCKADHAKLLAEYTTNAKEHARQSAAFANKQKEIEVRYIDRIQYIDQFQEVQDESKCDTAMRLFRSFGY